MGNKYRPLIACLPGILLIALGAWSIYRGPRTAPALLGNASLILLGILLIHVARTFRKITQMYRDLWEGKHEYRAATQADLAKLDLSFYEHSTAALQREGYRYVDDVVNVSISKAWPKNHAVLRHLLGDNGTTTCTVYHLRLYGFVRLVQMLKGTAGRMKIIECDTELSDGTYVTTANNAEVERTLGYPFRDRVQYPLESPPEMIVYGHRAHLESVLMTKGSEVVPVRVIDAKELRQSQDRLHLKKCALRRGPGFNYHAEWESVAGRPLNPLEVYTAEKIATELASDDQDVGSKR